MEKIDQKQKKKYYGIIIKNNKFIMEKEKVKIFNSSKNELPDYGSEKSAGFDIRSDFSKIISESDFIGNGKYVFKNDDNDDKKILLLKPNGRILIPTGLRVAIPDGYELQVRPRSGLALKHGITVLNSPGTIDSDYRGLVGVILLNTSDKTFEIEDGFRIAQGVLNNVKQCDWVDVNSLDDLEKTDRGEGGFGSTGVK